eukprot:CAMPEP_0117557488 /NCGR_PEP_ID=MMETSP0784-20121206/52353_1 /TAXON_ID=39447 /ORGANISM="" /LENGTH=333 /DNA_ID=CAMNT_0005354801 /DNA_START=114 /DNA_END=1111 /DNA_ORIENTATION=+
MNLDIALHVLRHITNPSCDTFYNDIDKALRSSGVGPSWRLAASRCSPGSGTEFFQIVSDGEDDSSESRCPTSGSGDVTSTIDTMMQTTSENVLDTEVNGFDVGARPHADSALVDLSSTISTQTDFGMTNCFIAHDSDVLVHVASHNATMVVLAALRPRIIELSHLFDEVLAPTPGDDDDSLVVALACLGVVSECSVVDFDAVNKGLLSRLEVLRFLCREADDWASSVSDGSPHDVEFDFAMQSLFVVLVDADRDDLDSITYSKHLFLHQLRVVEHCTFFAADSPRISIVEALDAMVDWAFAARLCPRPAISLVRRAFGDSAVMNISLFVAAWL